MKYDVLSTDEFIAKSEQLSQKLRDQTYLLTYYVLSITGIFLFFLLLFRTNNKIRTGVVCISVVLALEVLMAGPTSQMIELGTAFNH